MKKILIGALFSFLIFASIQPVKCQADTVGTILQTAVGAVLGVLGFAAVDVTVNNPKTLNVYAPENVNVYKSTPTATPNVTPES
jgi:hypothetical protein